MSVSTNHEEHENETDKKKHSFNRNPSIEKIIKFNTYICSQNFFILPAILTWLKTSQTHLRSYSEKCRKFVKIFTVDSIKTAEEIYRNPEKSLGLKMKRKLLGIATYFCLFLICFQLAVCLVLLGINSMPNGLIFMLFAMSYICYMEYLCLRLIILKQKYKDEHEKDFENEATTKYIRPKDILGKRTISSLNLF